MPWRKLRFVSPEYERIEQLVLGLSHQLDAFTKEMRKAMSALSDALTQLQADVAAESTVVDSAVTLLNGLAAQIDQLVANSGGNPIDPQALTDLSTQIKDKTNALSNAVAADTRPAGATGATGATGPSA